MSEARLIREIESRFCAKVLITDIGLMQGLSENPSVTVLQKSEDSFSAHYYKTAYESDMRTEGRLLTASAAFIPAYSFSTNARADRPFFNKPLLILTRGSTKDSILHEVGHLVVHSTKPFFKTKG